MPVDIAKERAVETFKSLIQISVAGFKLLALLNGGAAVAILAYLGNIAGKGQATPDMVVPMGCYLAGLVLCGFAFLGSYVTQFVLFNEAMERMPQGRHQRWVFATMGFVVLSLVAFAIGSFFATLQLGGIRAVPNVVTRGTESWQSFVLGEPNHAGLSWEAVAALASAIVALCAFVVTIYQVRTTQKHNRLSVKPFLATWADSNHNDNRYSVELLNNGIGPALIKSFNITVDGKQIGGEPSELVEKGLKLLFPKCNYESYQGYVGPGYMMAPKEQRPDEEH